MQSHRFFPIARRALALCLDAALPRACILCGCAIPLASGSAPGPLCLACRAALRPWRGERCPSCGLPLVSEIGSCMRCRGTPRAFESAYPLYSYDGAMRTLVSAYKKGRRRSLAPLFAELLGAVIEERWPGRPIVPVPPRRGKAMVRGWDQVEEIARILEKRGLRVERPLQRGRSAEQKSLDRGGRGANAKKAYSLKSGRSSPEQPILLDDVVTTCATLEACALALKGGGALRVDAVLIAAD